MSLRDWLVAKGRHFNSLLRLAAIKLVWAPKARAAAVDKLADAWVVAVVARTDPDPAVRCTAVGKLTDSAVLRTVAMSDPDSTVRCAAVSNFFIGFEALVTIVQTDKDFQVIRCATGRLNLYQSSTAARGYRCLSMISR